LLLLLELGWTDDHYMIKNLVFSHGSPDTKYSISSIIKNEKIVYLNYVDEG